jgi:hypothetical protein
LASKIKCNSAVITKHDWQNLATPYLGPPWVMMSCTHLKLQSLQTPLRCQMMLLPVRSVRHQDTLAHDPWTAAAATQQPRSNSSQAALLCTALPYSCGLNLHLAMSKITQKKTPKSSCRRVLLAGSIRLQRKHQASSESPRSSASQQHKHHQLSLALPDKRP